MRSNAPWRQRWSAASCALALLALTMGTALAAAPSTTAYHFSSHPMISGTVVTVNDHQMVVDTDQGEQVTLEVDTRTMAPRDLAPGMVMRAEFLALEECRLYAQRIMPIRRGMSTNRLQAYANTSDSREAVARNTTAFGDYRGASTPSERVGAEARGPMVIATPTSSDYQFSTRPEISGIVVAVNDHRLVVKTDQGQQVRLVMDSRTLVPGEVTPGTVVRAEFTPMKDGRYYAKRVGRITSGVAEREQAYAHTRDSDFVIAQNTPDCGYASAAVPNAEAAAVERRGEAEVSDLVVAQRVPEPVAERPETLPQTASNQPLLLLLGMVALGSAGLVTALRGRRNV